MCVDITVFPYRNRVLEMFDHAYQNYMVRQLVQRCCPELPRVRGEQELKGLTQRKTRAACP